MKNLHKHYFVKPVLLPALLVSMGLFLGGCPKKVAPPVEEKKVEIKEPVKEPEQPEPASVPKKVEAPEPAEPVKPILPVTKEPVKPKPLPDVAEIVSQYQIVHFEVDKSRLIDEARQALQRNAERIRHDLQQYPDLKLLVEGHCDERGTNEYNLSLGERRAFNVRDYLISLGVPSSILFTKSWGEERPSDFGHDEDSWAKNRRAEFQVYKGS